MDGIGLRARLAGCLLMVGLMAAGCNPQSGGAAAPVDSPYKQKADAQGQIAEADAAILEQQQAQIDADRESARKIAEDSALTENEIKRLNAPLDARQRELELKRGELELKAQADAQALEQAEALRQKALDDAEAQKKLVEIQGEIERQKWLAEFQYWKDVFYAFYWPALDILIGLAVLGVIGLVGATAVGWVNRRMRVQETPDGTGLWIKKPDIRDGEPVEWEFSLLVERWEKPKELAAKQYPNLNEQEQVIEEQPYRAVEVAPMAIRDESVTGLAIAVLFASIKEKGPKATTLVGWRDVQKYFHHFTSHGWKTAVNAMRELGWVDTDERQRTFLVGEGKGGKFKSIVELYDHLRKPNLILIPADPPTPPQWAQD